MSLGSLIAEAIVDVESLLEDEVIDDESWARDDVQSVITEAVPAMTTTLFMLVVADDNALAFEEVDDADTPFVALSQAVRRRIEVAVQEHLESRIETEEVDA